MSAGKKVKAKFVPIDVAELAIRMCEANYGMRRPPGMTGSQALEAMESDVREGWLRSARAAMDYWTECIEQEVRNG
jgi:hypothetical protein